MNKKLSNIVLELILLIIFINLCNNNLAGCNSCKSNKDSESQSNSSSNNPVKPPKPVIKSNSHNNHIKKDTNNKITGSSHKVKNLYSKNKKTTNYYSNTNKKRLNTDKKGLSPINEEDIQYNQSEEEEEENNQNNLEENININENENENIDENNQNKKEGKEEEKKEENTNNQENQEDSKNENNQKEEKKEENTNNQKNQDENISKDNQNEKEEEKNTNNRENQEDSKNKNNQNGKEEEKGKENINNQNNGEENINENSQNKYNQKEPAPIPNTGIKIGDKIELEEFGFVAELYSETCVRLYVKDSTKYFGIINIENINEFEKNTLKTKKVRMIHIGYGNGYLPFNDLKKYSPEKTDWITKIINTISHILGLNQQCHFIVFKPNNETYCAYDLYNIYSFEIGSLNPPNCTTFLYAKPVKKNSNNDELQKYYITFFVTNKGERYGTFYLNDKGKITLVPNNEFPKSIEEIKKFLEQ